MAKITNTAPVATVATAKVARVRTAKVSAPIVILTAGQKAMATKVASGMDLSAVALKAAATRRANIAARELATAQAERAERLTAIALKAVATRRANIALAAEAQAKADRAAKRAARLAA
jgi:hypothetical protein